MDIIQQYLTPPVIWFLAGIITLLFEFMYPGLILFFFGFGAIVVSLILLMFSISLNMQLALFLIVSVISLALLRQRFKIWFLGARNQSVGIDDQEGFSGKQATVVEDISPAKNGKVDFRGSLWEAVSEDEIKKGDIVEVLRKENITLVVKQINKSNGEST